MTPIPDDLAAELAAGFPEPGPADSTQSLAPVPLPGVCLWCIEPSLPARDLCAEHAAGEAAALATDPHAGLDRNGPGFFERARLTPFNPTPPQRLTAPVVTPASIPPGEHATAYGRAAIDNIGRRLADDVGSGDSRNLALFKAAAQLARLAVAGHVDERFAHDHAERLAEELTPDERWKAKATVRRAFAFEGVER